MQIEMAGMGSGGMYDEDGQLQQDYDNPKVQEIREELGAFDFDASPNNGNEAVEMRQQLELENHARYDGEWIINSKIRQGKGR